VHGSAVHKMTAALCMEQWQHYLRPSVLRHAGACFQTTRSAPPGCTHQHTSPSLRPLSPRSSTSSRHSSTTTQAPQPPSPSCPWSLHQTACGQAAASGPTPWRQALCARGSPARSAQGPWPRPGSAQSSWARCRTRPAPRAPPGASRASSPAAAAWTCLRVMVRWVGGGVRAGRDEAWCGGGCQTHWCHARRWCGTAAHVHAGAAKGGRARGAELAAHLLRWGR
jgi:hypothetical protein